MRLFSICIALFFRLVICEGVKITITTTKYLAPITAYSCYVTVKDSKLGKLSKELKEKM